MVCLLFMAGKSLPRPVGRPILELVPVLLPKPAPERRGFVMENVAERATPRVGKLTGEKKSGPRKAICAAGSNAALHLPSIKDPSPSSRKPPLQPTPLPGTYFRSVRSIPILLHLHLPP